MKLSLFFAGLIGLTLLTGCGGNEEPQMIDDAVRPPMAEEQPVPASSVESTVTVVEPDADEEAEVTQ